ncbi:hypothetical protein Tco_0088621 [Tanacetum coccineum]
MGARRAWITFSGGRASLGSMTQNCISDLKSGAKGKILEAKVYRKWIYQSPPKPAVTDYCCILIDKEVGEHGHTRYPLLQFTSPRRRMISCPAIIVVDPYVKLAISKKSLYTMWDVSDSLGMVCSLCESVPDSHDHLFFECPFAKGIWDRVKDCAAVAKLVVPAPKPHLCMARANWRLFKKGKRSPDQIVECIKSSVRLKLLSCKLKKSKNGERLARLWDLPEAVFK